MTRTATIHAIQKWEYHFLTKKTEVYLAKELSELGLLGWELVSVGQCRDRGGELAWTAFLKRPYIAREHSEPAAQTTAETAPAQESRPSPGSESSQPAAGFDPSDGGFALREE